MVSGGRGMEKIVILGKVPAKSNCYRIGLQGDRRTLVKGPDLTGYEQSFWWQCRLRGKPGAPLTTAPFRLTVDVYFHKRACDLDNSLKIILDVLQKPCYVIDNDNQCAEIHARKLIDRINPRIEFTIEPLI